MDSMNNWLGFSFSPQQVLSSQPSQNLGMNSDEISAGTEEVSGECFDLTSDSTIPSLNLPAPFGILEAFNRNNQSQDWNLKEMSMNSFSCSSQNLENQEGPRLENFLGGHSYNDQEHKKYQSSTCNNITASSHIYQEPDPTSHPTSNRSGIGMNGNSTIGLSMIKNWLRNNPALPQPEENTAKNEAEPPPCTASAQTLSLSMSTGTQSDSPLPFLNGNVGESSTLDSKQHPGNALESQTGAIASVPRKSIDTFGQRTSIYRGVTRHRWTGRYEAHLWDNSCRREGQTRKGRQGGYDKEEKAARAYDLAALKYWGSTTTTNFPISNYEKELEEMKHMTRQEYVASLRRKSSGFSRGASIYRGVTRHHQHGRWQARIGRVAGNKDLYLGTFTHEKAAEAYDIAAIKFLELNVVTNFEISRYDVKSILESSTLPIGGAAKRLKDAENAELALDIQRRASNGNPISHLTDGLNGYNNGWPNAIAFHQPQPLSMPYTYPQQRYLWCKQEHDLEVNRNIRNIHNIHDLHQLHSGNMQNFLQPSVLHNLMSLDSSSMEHDSGSNSLVYSNGAGGDSNRHSASYQLGEVNGNNGNFAVPMGMVLVQEGLSQNQTNGFGENEVKPFMFGSGDPYQTRNLMSYESQQSSDGMEKASVYDQASATCNNWMPTGVPTLAARPNNVVVCHGGSTFTVWNDT
ncbi:unnamed protein product [Fraxinus pennsylvanica]|uniref:AP2/ERF domain-containing protein n=1 Tax=Fraxinus pennsylvanica TaxID=56036 RepID=A0AAD2AFQ7_9LAMI|nr:unnamed protein product [Fraxinus pennsylvanica]